jgi:hypothetical protein
MTEIKRLEARIAALERILDQLEIVNKLAEEYWRLRKALQPDEQSRS